MDEKCVEKISFEELQNASKPLLELLRQKGHPHMSALVTGRSVALMEDVMGVPLNYED